MEARVESQSMRVRLATLADAGTLAAFAARTFRGAYEPPMPWDDLRAYCEAAYNESRQAAELTDPAIVTLLAEVGGTLVGFAQLRNGCAPACVESRQPIELWRLYVDARWQGNGVAQALMQRAEETGRSRDARLLWLAVWEHNARAQAFYAKCGFVQVGTCPFKLGREQQTDLVLVRALR